MILDSGTYLHSWEESQGFIELIKEMWHAGVLETSKHTCMYVYTYTCVCIYVHVGIHKHNIHGFNFRLDISCQNSLIWKRSATNKVEVPQIYHRIADNFFFFLISIKYSSAHESLQSTWKNKAGERGEGRGNRKISC